MPLHSQAKFFLTALEEENPPSWQSLAPEAGRTLFASLTHLFGNGPGEVRTEDLELNGASMRMYRPNDDQLPALMFFHGGGWVLGDLETHDALCRRLANLTNRAVFAVDYRRAPESSFPDALNDCYRATCFVAEHADALGVHADRLATVGDSAGGHLATTVALRCIQQQGPELEAQVLIYPVISPDFDRPSYVDCAEGFGLTRETMMWFWDQYVPQIDQRSDPAANPLLSDSLDGLPRSLVITAEYDVLRDEGEAYADALRSTGVDVQLQRFDGLIHGFVHMAKVFDDSQTAIESVAEFLEK